jgi:hypothetical protein
MKLSSILTALAVVLCIGCQRQQPSVSEEATPSVAVSFRGLWFSEDEMRRLGQGETAVSPTQDVELEAWEFTDPIGTPHPDVVNVIVRITSPSDAPPRDVRIGVREQWKTGSAEGESTAAWGDPLPERQLDGTSRLASGAITEVRLPVAVGNMVRTLGSKDRYPWRLRVLVELRDASSSRSLVTADKELPIIPGD